MTISSYEMMRHWLFDKALPFWLVHGVDRNEGGFVEQLSLDGSNAHVDFKRVRVVARQIYVFSHAALLGVPEAQPAADHGFEFLTRNAWLGDAAGWARALNRAGTVIDPTPDLYDLAFVLYALGWYHRATKKPEALVWAHRTRQFIDTHMRHPSGGFQHQRPCDLPLQQNPHMHLLEAALVVFEATGDKAFKSLADEIVTLFLTRLYDGTSRTLVEFYDENWRRFGETERQLVEPGHLYEWAWILSTYRRLTQAQVDGPIRGLIDFAETYGLDRVSGSVINAVNVAGLPLDAGCRVWPNTERIQAAVAAFEVFGDDPRPIFDAAVPVIFRLFLDPAPRGTWIDRRTQDGTIAVASIPASTLYHIMIAAAEMLRIETAVERTLGPSRLH